MTRDELIARILERPGPDAVAALHAELARDLREDPAAADAYLAERELDADLRRLMSPQGGSVAFIRGVLAAAAQERMPSQRFISRVVRRQRRSRWPRRLAIGSALAAAALVIAFLAWPTPPRHDQDHQVAILPPAAGGGRLTIGSGTGLILHRGAVVRPAVAGDRFQAGDLLEGAGKGLVRLQWLDAAGRPDATRLDLLGGSRLLVVAAAEAFELSLEVGRIQAEVAPRPPDRPLRIRTPHAVAVIVGTRFALTADAARSLLEVDEGRVRFEGAHGSELVAAGEAVVANSRGLGRCGPWIDLMPDPGKVVPQVDGTVRSQWMAGTDADGRWLRQSNRTADVSFVFRTMPRMQGGIIECEIRTREAGPGALAGTGFWQAGRDAARKPMYSGAWHEVKAETGVSIRLHGMFSRLADSRISTDMVGTDSRGSVERSLSDDERRERSAVGYIDRISMSCNAAVVEFRSLRVRAINEP